MADTNNPNDPAFPTEEVHGDGIQQIKRHQGFTKREAAAVEMATGLLASRTTDELSYDDISDRAIAQADSLLAKLAVHS